MPRHRVRSTFLVALALAALSLVAALGVLGRSPTLDLPATVGAQLRVVPSQVRLLSPEAAGGGGAWALFDGDTGTALVAADAAPIRLAVTLPGSVDVESVGVFQGSGRLQVSARAGNEDLPVADLVLGAVTGGWQRFTLGERLAAASWIVEWQPPAQGARLPEIEMWTRRPGAPGADRSAAKAQRREIAARPVEGGGAGSFQFWLDGEPAAFERVFLAYRVSGLSDGAAAPRSLNGRARIGGLPGTTDAVFASPTAGSQVVEEIDPAWLQRGSNILRFTAATAGEPPPVLTDLRWLLAAASDDAGAEPRYAVSDVRLLVVPRAGRPAITETGADPGPSAAAAALVDGDAATGWRGEDDPANPLPATLDLPFRRAAQPLALELTFDGAPAGRLWLEALLDGGGARPAVEPLDLGTLAAGWNEVALDAGLPAASGLRLSWQGADEGGARLTEVGVLASPVGRPSARPRLAVSLLRRVGDGAYLRGFVTPLSVAGGAPELFVDGAHVGGALAAGDGAFELFVPRPVAAAAGWAVEIEAIYPDGLRVSRRLSVDAAPGAAPQDSSGLRAERKIRATPGRAMSLDLDGARLAVGEGAVGREVTLSMRPLARFEVPAMDGGMYNVTAPHAGLRMGPHGMRFERPVRLEMAFDPELLPTGTTAEDVRTFYFDEASGRWVVLPRVVVDAAAERVVSATDHFTNFVNAVLVAPDEPAGPGYTPNSMTALESADPASGLTLIAPPAASSSGDAELTFPLVVPPGRLGMEPDLALAYSSGGGNGWLGLGWDLALSSIEVSTLFGVPRYDAGRESESYLLDGTFLAPVIGGASAPRLAERHFAQRVEGAFARIVRHGSRPDDYWWEVSGKDGVRYEFGRTADARLASPRGGEIFRWLLEAVVDRNGNRVDYEYRRDSGTDGEDWVQLYPRRIAYTAGPGLAAFYEVRFLLDDEVAGAPARLDRLSSGLPGFKTYTRRRLARVEVYAGPRIVRAYDLVYENGAFSKTLLSEIVARGEGGAAELFRHRFDYQPLGYWSEDEVDGFSSPVAWGRLGSDDDQSDHFEIGGGFHAFAGLGDPSCRGFHGGVQGGFTIGDDTLRRGMVDVDGDGLPDRLREDGRVELNTLAGFDGGSTTVDGADALGHTESLSFDFGAGLHGPGEVGQLSVNWVWTHANDDRAVADVDGDLRPDLVSTDGGFSWRRNTGAGFEAPRLGSGFSLAGLALETDGEETELKSAYYPTDTLLKLKLPYAGVVEVTGAIRKREAGGDGVAVSIYKDGSRVWRRQLADDDLAACTPDDGGGCGGGLTLAVTAGDRLYFRAAVGDDVEHDAVDWAPVVTYAAVGLEPLPAARLAEREPWGAPLFVFDHGADFRLAGPPGGGWVAIAAGRVAVLGEVVKQPTADDVVLRVERDGTLVFSETFAAAQQGTFAPSIPLLDVAAEDALTFFLDSASQVDPARVAWAPTVTYEGGEYCRQPIDGGTPACGAVSCDEGEEGICTLAGDPTPGLVLRRDEIRRAAGVEVHAADWQALSGPTRSNPAPESDEGIDLVLAWTRSPLQTGKPASLLIQGEHRLFARCEVPASGFAKVCRADDVKLTAGEPVYFTVLAAPASTLAAVASIDGEGAAVNLRSPAMQPDPLAGGYHGWFYGEWNGTLSFSELAFLPQQVKQRQNNDQPPAWSALSPAPQGTDDYSGAAWIGSGHGFHLAATQMKPARFGSSVGPMLREANGGGGGGPTLLRKTTGRTAAFSASLFAGAALSLGYADSQLDLLDMNADGYVDQVSEGKVRFSDGHGAFGNDETIEHLAGAVRHVEDASLTLGVTVGVPYSQKNGSATARAVSSTAPSVGQTTTLSQTRSDLVDVNGDGLPDRVELEPGDGGELTMTVRLNLGYRFGEKESWSLDRWSEGTRQRCNEGLDFASAAVLDAIAGVEDPDALSLTTSAAYDVGLALGMFGGGVNATLSRTLVELVDVNGDGLADRVAKDDGEEFFRVQLNLGDRWGAEERWHAPDWTTSLGDGYDPGISVAGTDVFNCFDAVSLYGHLGGSGSVGAPICIPLVPPKPVVGLYLEFAGQVFGGDGGLQLDLEDVDGDGLLDHVLKKGNDGNVHVRRNQVGQTNLLKTVHRPLGGRIEVSYRRQGNRVETIADGAGERPVDMPFSRWVLATSTVHDGRGNAYATTYDYFNDGYYDRGERVFYGFRQVEATLADGSRVDTFFHNDDFHLRGLPFKETVADAAGNLFRVEEWRYEERPVRGELTAAAVFPALVEEATYLYDGTTASESGFGKATRVTYDYDAAGNVVVSRDYADEGAADDVVVTTAYLFDEASYQTLPRQVEVRDAGGDLLRRQRMAYDGRGNLVTLAATLDGGRDPETGATYADATATWTWSYDARGVRASATDPVGFTTSTTYDPATGTYPVTSSDSFGYTTSAAWDLAHGVAVETTDANGNSARYAYDGFGRLLRVVGPYDTDASPLVAYEYAPDATPPRAVVHHKDVTRADPIDVIVFIDGLGRTLQIKRDTEVDLGSGSAGRVGMQVEGSVAFDVKGRVAASGQPFFDSGPAGTFVERPLVRPTRYEYDTVDRLLEVRFPHGASTRLQYGFATLDGIQRLAVDRFDGNGRRTRSYLHVGGDLLGVEQTNEGRRLVTRYEYNPLSELTSVTDAAGHVTRLELDTLGRRVVVDQPDSGRLELRYDRAGNLGAEIPARLAASGGEIRYRRTFHRLDRVDYPEKTDAVFTWGEPGAPYNRAGRLARVDDESGSEETFYGKRGEVVQTLKTATSLNGFSPKGPYEIAYEFDSFDRLLAMVYPDGERLEYGFDAGGRVKSAAGTLRGRRYEYLRHLGYDELGDPVRTVYGNGVETTTTYDPASRFPSRLLTRAGGRELQDLAFHHDPVGTLLGVDNEVPLPRPNQLGGPSSQTFAYDDLYQLVAANGSYRSAPNKTSRYELSLAYDDVGNLTAKSQLHELVQPGGPAIEQKKTSYDWTLAYDGPQPDAPTQIGERSFSYDADGNQLGWDHDANGTRRSITWDEGQRVAAVADNGRTTRYLYDADGLRTNKAGPDGETIYVNRYFSVRNGALGSKHVFADDHRLASKLGQPSLNAGDDGNGKGSGKDKGKGNGQGNGNGGGQPVEDKLYFYHGDHVGSSHFVTDADGEVYQHLEYFPHGELWVDERAESERTPYLFAAQELDEETGLQAIGARYYDPRQGQWLSPDPSYEGMLDPASFAVADSSLAPFRLPGHMYAYAANSPTSLVDGTGLAYTDIKGISSGMRRTRFNRAVEIHGKLQGIPLKRKRGGTTDKPYDLRTTAIAYVKGSTTSYVASSSDTLHEQQLAALGPNEKAVTSWASATGHDISVDGLLGSGDKAHHAERKAFAAAVASGADPADVEVFPSRTPCRGCQTFRTRNRDGEFTIVFDSSHEQATSGRRIVKARKRAQSTTRATLRSRTHHTRTHNLVPGLGEGPRKRLRAASAPRR